MIQTVVLKIAHAQGGGYEPIVVISALPDSRAAEVVEHVKQTMGVNYVPARLLTLDDLGLKEFPVNATFKIAKSVLEQAVSQCLMNEGKRCI